MRNGACTAASKSKFSAMTRCCLEAPSFAAMMRG
jgi:hypothetical protein